MPRGVGQGCWTMPLWNTVVDVSARPPWRDDSNPKFKSSIYIITYMY